MAKPRVVLDTNVVVSALRSDTGASAQVLELLDHGMYRAFISTPVFFEYEAVVTRTGYALGLSLNEIAEFLDWIRPLLTLKEPDVKIRPFLRHANDDKLLELAAAARCRAIVTHNVADFVGSEKYGVEILKPAEFLAILGERT